VRTGASKKIAAGHRQRLIAALERRGQRNGTVKIRSERVADTVVFMDRPDTNAWQTINAEFRRPAMSGKEKAGSLQSVVVKKDTSTSRESIFCGHSSVGGIELVVCKNHFINARKQTLLFGCIKNHKLCLGGGLAI
jgi:hypothetical protein